MKKKKTTCPLLRGLDYTLIARTTVNSHHILYKHLRAVQRQRVIKKKKEEMSGI